MQSQVSGLKPLYDLLPASARQRTVTRPSINPQTRRTNSHACFSTVQRSTRRGSGDDAVFAKRRGLLAHWMSTIFQTLALAVLGNQQPALGLPLGPLGQVQRVGGEKLYGLSAQDVRDILERDLREGQYFVTGNLTKEVFADDCRFKDPTNDVTGLSRYLKALGVLFDPGLSSVVVKDVRVTSDNTIEADWILQGVLKFFWRPSVPPFNGHTVYTLNSEGLVQTQEQQWSISATEAIIESFTPSSAFD